MLLRLCGGVEGKRGLVCIRLDSCREGGLVLRDEDSGDYERYGRNDGSLLLREKKKRKFNVISVVVCDQPRT